jgi:hypothetical protein
MHYDKPTEGIWSLLKRSMVNFAAADLDGLVRIVKRKLKKIQYRPHLIDGCLAATGLRIEPPAIPLTLEYLLIIYSVCSE